MSASPQIIPTGISQYRNAMLTSVVSRGDPFLAITFCQVMVAYLPLEQKKQAQEKIEKMDSKSPKKYHIYHDFYTDPDGQKNVEAAWNYWREFLLIVEESWASFVATGQGMRSLG